MAETNKYLAIYLNDHLAGSTTAVEMVKRAVSENEGTELGDFLARLKGEIEEDRTTLQEIMSTLGVKRDHVKLTAAWVGEKAGRLKLNGELFSYSPLSRVVELEFLLLGITGKLGLWRVLDATLADRLPAVRLDELIARAERQRNEVEGYRLAATATAFRA
jgi:hypothetical protein